MSVERTPDVPAPTQGQPHVVVIDDHPANVKVLTAVLAQEGYRVEAWLDPRAGLQSILAEPPDLVLLDITMPEMDGYTVCQRMKEVGGRVASIPVVFLSALDGTEAIVRGFEVGGVDFVTKPFRAAEIRARVRTHVELSQTRRALESSHDQLRELERLRDSLTAMVIHDLRTPLTGLALTLELLDGDERLDPELREDIVAAQESTHTMARLVDGVLDVSRLEAGQMPTHIGDFSAGEVVDAARRHLGPLAADKRLRVGALAAERMRCDLELTSRVLTNMVANALSFVSEATGCVDVAASTSPERVRIEVADDGPGISDQDQKLVFEKFGQAMARARGHRAAGSGLGLTFCRLAVEAQGGVVGLDSRVGSGSRFWFELPRAHPAAPGNGARKPRSS